MMKKMFLRCMTLLSACTVFTMTACSREVAKPATFTVSFNTDGGSLVEAQTVKYGELATRPEKPTKSGFTFVDWFADEKLVTLFDFAKVEITADWTLYAKWDESSLPPGPVDPTNITFTVTDLPEWIQNDGCVIFAWVWGGDSDISDGAWVELTYGQNHDASFEAPDDITGFLLARCIAGTTIDNVSWKVAGDNPGRIYNQTENINVTKGTTSYSCSSWKSYGGGK